MQTLFRINVDPAKAAYDEAVTSFREILTEDESKRSWLDEKSNIDEIQDAVCAAQKAYESKRGDNKLRKWLSKLSARVLFYSTILDTMAQHHPEYVALAWGSIKFLLRSLINHEELLTQLSKALSEIGEVLPRLEIQAFLYESAGMKRAVSMLYAHIIKFFHRAMAWFTESRTKHMISSICRPYELRFKDLVDDIARSSRCVDQLAFAAAQAEIRQMHHEQRELTNIVLETRQIIIENQSLNFRGFLDSNRRLCEIHFSQILTVTSSACLPSPEQSFQYSKFFSTRRRRRNGNDHDSWWRSPKLQEWAASRTSSLVIIRANTTNRLGLKALATELIELLRGLDIPVIWTLSTAEKGRGQPTQIDVLKQLIFQALQINHKLLNDNSPALNPAGFQSARTEEHWFNILATIVRDFAQLYIVLDGTLIDSRGTCDLYLPFALHQLVAKLQAECPKTIVKIVLVNHLTKSLAFPAPDVLEDSTLWLQDDRRQNMMARKKQRPRPGTNAKRQGSDLLRPFISRMP